MSQLTGSCLPGREEWIRGNGIDVDRTYSVKEFCALTRRAYGSEYIEALLDYLREKEEK